MQLLSSRLKFPSAVVLAACLYLAGVSPVQADTTYSGRAFAASVNSLLTGQVYVSDTGNLATAGGVASAGLLSSNVGGILIADVLTAATNGSTGQSNSSATIADVAVLPGLLNELRATLIRSETHATCAGLNGFSEIAGLVFCGLPITVTGAPNQTINLLAATLVINEQIFVNNGTYHEIRVNALHLSVPGIADVILAGSKSGIDCQAVTGHSPCFDFISGGGFINIGSCQGTLGFNAGFKPNTTIPTVNLNFIDHNTGMTVHATTITLFQAVSSNCRHFEGACDINGTPGNTYKVDCTDNGDPGVGLDTFAITLSTGYSANGTLGGGNNQLVSPCKISSITLNPTSTCGGHNVTGTVKLFSPAGVGGLTVALTSSNPAVASVPPSVTVAQGSISATFTIITSPVTLSTPVDISASIGDEIKTVKLTVNPLKLISLTVSPTSVCGKLSVTGKVSIDCPASVGGIVVNLSTNRPDICILPTSVMIPEGSVSATFAIATVEVPANVAVVISATLASVTKTATLTIKSPGLASITLIPSSICGGLSGTGRVSLSCPAPPGGLVVNLSCGNLEVAIPATVTVAAGESAAAFPYATIDVPLNTSAVIMASCAGVNKTATLTIKASTLLSISLSATSICGNLSLTGKVTLGCPAPVGGLVINLNTDNPCVLVPPTVTVPAGATTCSFPCSTTGPAADVIVIVSASLNGVIKMATTTVKAQAIVSVTCAPVSLIGGVSATGKVTLRCPAAAGGVIVNLGCSDPLSIILPVSVFVAAGATTASFTVKTAPVAVDLLGTISASLGASTQTCGLTIKAAVLTSFTLSPNPLTAGLTATGTVILNGPAPIGGMVVSLSSSIPLLCSVPNSVTIPAGATSATFPCHTSILAALLSAVISATCNRTTLTNTLNIL